MTEDRTRTKFTPKQISFHTPLADSHYGILGLPPSASVWEIRRAYRELSKRYHPDTTELAAEVATAQFRRLNEAYATLSHPERRSLYDLQIGYSRWNVIQSPQEFREKATSAQFQQSNSAYLDPTDRPLSPGEIFALFLMGATLLGCLFLAIAIAWLRGDEAWQMSTLVNFPNQLIDAVMLLKFP